MHRVSGGCHCGNILVDLELSSAPSAYHPRACDCDFCRKHGAAYVSDPQGSLLIRVKNESDCGKYRQGSGIADCLVCRNCGVLVGVCCLSDGDLYAAVNAKVLDDRTIFAAVQSVSPKQLSANDKVARWKDIWFADVSVTHGDA